MNGDKHLDPVKREKQCSHTGGRHALLMIVCCLVPLGGAFLLNRLGYGGAASYLVMLLCPLMHLFMMKDMFKGKPEQPKSDG